MAKIFFPFSFHGLGKGSLGQIQLGVYSTIQRNKDDGIKNLRLEVFLWRRSGLDGRKSRNMKTVRKNAICSIIDPFVH